MSGFEPGVLAKSLQPFVESHTLPGAVTLAATKDGVLSLETVGWADIAAGRPMRPDTLFWIASMSKPITATAVMMVVDEGKVKLDDPVGRYLPEFRGQMVAVESDEEHRLLKRPSHPITVREALSHTAGLAFISPLEQAVGMDRLTVKEAAISYGTSALRFEPGSQYEYSNAGINTAARILEVVSGIPYEQFLQERLFTPLGMKDTTFQPSVEQVERLAKAYKPNASNNGLESCLISQLSYPLTDRARQPMPGGGLFGTATDMYLFCRMILNGGSWEGRRYVSEAAITQMTSTQTGDLMNGGKGEHGYGLGWTTERRDHGEPGVVIPGPCGHGGALKTSLWIDPRLGLIRIYMVQVMGYPGPDGEKVFPAFAKAVDEAFAGLPAR